jgi:general secretion pathway protein M
MKEWWNNLALREKRIVSAGILTLAALLVYLILWLPLDNAVTGLRTQIHQNQELLTWMRDADKHLQTLSLTTQPKPKSTSSGSILTIVQNQINRTTLVSSLNQMHQVDTNSVQLTFQKVDFDQLVTWLIQLNQQHGIVITQMNVIPSPTPGVVAADLVLKM